MSEKAPQHHERHHSPRQPETIHHSEQHRPSHEHAEQAPQATAEHLQNLREQVEQKAISGAEHTPAEDATEQNAAMPVGSQLKAMALQRNLKLVQRRESTVARTFSKVIHNPVIERVSEVSAATVARPSGLLGGGLFAFVGSFILLQIVRHYGYEYNYLAFAVLFLGGFVAGLTVEMLIKLVRRSRS